MDRPSVNHTHKREYALNRVKLQYRHIEFVPDKSGVITVVNRKSKTALAYVEYYDAWDEFCVVDVVPGTVWSKSCLLDMAVFLGDINRLKKQSDRETKKTLA